MPVHNITVPYVDVKDFDWGFNRTGPLPWNQTVWSILAVFTAVPLWMTVELTIWVFYVFRRWSGLYFWSVLICTWGVTLHAIGFILKFCVPSCNWIVSTTLAEIGWVSMVTGFSVVLYSRLHLVVRSQRILKFVLIMVITDAFLFHVPTIVFQYGVSANKKTHAYYLPFMAPMERVQVLGFSIQEVLISAIYIWATLRMLKGSFNKKIRNTIMFLILIQVVVILADVIVITLDYCEYFTLKAVLHSFVYAFKLQLEFVILNQFKDVIANGGIAPRGLEAMQAEQNDNLSPTPPSKPAASQKKWGSFITIGRVGTVESESKTEGSGSVTVKGAQTPPQPEIQGMRLDPDQISPYVAGHTDTLDTERQYLGTWDRADGKGVVNMV
ncbi:hypothetical protein IFR04_011166 [Cadophora malorum]|uniref:DUF7703 domain-containing protein n=1 Tax=Cadophora malorum TaxID=108018 RepID=A0A8H7W990_9HELO|nr:hypothetical protein IFR04_011166 [Cadophora malorum]